MDGKQKVECVLFLIIGYWITHGEAARGYYYETIDHDMDIYKDIERALYFDGSKIEMKRFITETFDLRNPNPAYTFVIPEDQEMRIVMRRADFKRPIFPNITEINMKLSRVAAKRSVEREQNGANPVRVNKLTAGPPPPAFNDIEDMAAENVQTERSFIEYMQRLNHKAEHFMTNIDGDEYRRQDKNDPMIRKRARPKKFKSTSSFPLMLKGEDEWHEFGLSGWGGEIISPRAFHGDILVEKPPETDVALVNANIKVKDSSTHNGAFTPMQWSFLDRHDNGPKWDLPGKLQRRDYTPIMDEINDVYSFMKTVMNTTVSPEWPITNPRGAHRNEDVYIARANDPFGYSTKWEFRDTGTHRSSRQKRGFGELYSMIKCSTGCDPLLLKGYGCYCGFLGSGHPADGIDRCCQAHDQCYGRANCPRYLQYFIPYIWKCYNGRPLCAVDNGEWGHCATQLCKCDLSLSACARRYRCPQRRQVCHSNRIRMIQNYLKII